jgi:hypothetical protein
MGRQDLSKLKEGLRRGIEIEKSLDSLLDKRTSLTRSKQETESDMEQLLSTQHLGSDPTTMTKSELQKILHNNNLSREGNKIDLVERILKNDIDLMSEGDVGTPMSDSDLKSKLLKLEDRIITLKSEIKQQEDLLRPYKLRKEEAELEKQEILKSYPALILDLLEGFGKSGSLISFAAVLWLVFAIATSNPYSFIFLALPVIAPMCAKILRRMNDPNQGPDEKLRDAIRDLEKKEAPIRAKRKGLRNIRAEKKSIKRRIEKAALKKLEIGRLEDLVKKHGDDINKVDREISELRSKLEENYADISHLVPFSYMLDK